MRVLISVQFVGWSEVEIEVECSRRSQDVGRIKCSVS